MDTAAVTAAASDVVTAAVLGKDVVAAYKTGGMSAVSALLARAVAEVEKDYTDISKALPSIKAGFKTSEFWLIVGATLGNGLYLAFTGKALPIDLNIVLGAVIAVYTAARAMTKSTATTAATVAAAR